MTVRWPLALLGTSAVVAATALVGLATEAGAPGGRLDAEASRVSTTATSGFAPAAFARLAPVAQAAVLDPLRRVAGDLDTAGRSAFPDGYTGVAISAVQRTVTVYATSQGTARAILRHAAARDPRADWSRVRPTVAPYSRVVLDAAAQRLVDAPHSNDIDAISVPVDGAGLDVEVAGESQDAGPVLPPILPPVPVPVRVVRASDLTAKSSSSGWAGVKWHDHAPFIGGDVLTANGKGYCTAGLPAVRRSDGHPVMITAAHCYRTGQRVYTGGGATGGYGNGAVGDYVGTVTGRSTTWDADELDGADNRADESDTRGWLPLTGVAYSYVGDYVCQAGAASFFLGHPTPCGIEVTSSDLWFPIGGYWARGVEGIDMRSGWGAHDGDSGGTVFAVQQGNRRQVRGIVSSGGDDGTPDQKRVDWTEAVDIFRQFRLTLNPQT